MSRPFFTFLKISLDYTHCLAKLLVSDEKSFLVAVFFLPKQSSLGNIAIDPFVDGKGRLMA